MVHYGSLGLSMTLNTRLSHRYSLVSRSPLSEPLIHSVIHSLSNTGAEMYETFVWMGYSTFSLRTRTREAEINLYFCALISPSLMIIIMVNTYQEIT